MNQTSSRGETVAIETKAAGARQATDTIIELQGVGVHYGRNHAVRDVSSRSSATASPP
ncbi:hypothetical protein GCM10029992_15840 [Glycomyces albus]